MKNRLKMKSSAVDVQSLYRSKVAQTPECVSGSVWHKLLSIWYIDLKRSCEILLWNRLVLQSSTVHVPEISCYAVSCRGASSAAPHAQESSRQAVNPVWSFICQSPPKCRTVRMDNSLQHSYTATSSCLAESLSVPQSPGHGLSLLTHLLQCRRMLLHRLQQRWFAATLNWFLSFIKISLFSSIGKVDI